MENNNNGASTKTFNLSLWNSQSVGNKTLTETWMHQDDQVVIGQISPPGYAFISVPRKCVNPKYQRGGVGILYKSQINLRQVTNLDLPNFQTFEFTVVSNMSRSLYIVLIYRPPPSTVNRLTVPKFLDEIEILIDRLDLLPGKLILLRDFNVHYDVPEKSDVKRFSTILASVGMIQHVTEPTHRSNHILDFVITRQEDSIMDSAIVDSITFTIDHFMVNCMLNMSKPKLTKVTQTIRKYKKINHETFSSEISAGVSSILNNTYTDANELLC